MITKKISAKKIISEFFGRCDIQIPNSRLSKKSEENSEKIENYKNNFC